MAFNSGPVSSWRRQNPAFVFWIFLVFGTVMAWPFFFNPVLQMIRATGWVQRTCTIVSSTVGRHSGSKGATYSVDITFAYTVDGQRYVSSRYQLARINSSGYGGKAAVVRRYPRGSQAVCFVNPANPQEAVMQRGLTPDMGFGAIPLFFIGFACVGLVTSRRRAALGGPEWLAGNTVPSRRPESADYVEMRPTMTPLGAVLLYTPILLVWTGVVCFLVHEAIAQSRSGRPEVGLYFMAGIFGIFELVILGMTVRAVMRWFDPGVQVWMKPSPLRLGQPSAVQWKIPVGSERIAKFTISLECREEAVYQQGKNQATDKSVCYRAAVMETAETSKMASGEAAFEIPARLMHSLDTGRNRIVWVMRVEGVVPHWAEIKDEYKLAVMPAKAAQPGQSV